MVEYLIVLFRIFTECSSEGILKIGQYLAKTWKKFGVMFFDTQCIVVVGTDVDLLILLIGPTVAETRQSYNLSVQTRNRKIS